jgi:hypothetical protein
LMTDYQEAAEGEWGCAPDSMSLAACSTRCLDEGCDPSLNMTDQEVNGMIAGEMMMSGVDEALDASVDEDVNQERSPTPTAQSNQTNQSNQGSNCQTILGSFSLYQSLLLFLSICWLSMRRRWTI